MEHWWVRMNLDNAWRDELIRQAEHERLVRLCKEQRPDWLGRLPAWLKINQVNRFSHSKNRKLSAV